MVIYQSDAFEGQLAASCPYQYPVIRHEAKILKRYILLHYLVWLLQKSYIFPYMESIKNFFKRTWKGPDVWSQIYATIIIAICSSIGLGIWSLMQNIPFKKAWTSALTYLKENSLSVNYLTLLIFLLVVVILAIPIIKLKIIRLQLKHLKFPKHLKDNYKLDDIFNGFWHLEYGKGKRKDGEEILRIMDGNKYYVEADLCFILTDIEYDKSKGILQWTKTVYSTNKKHSRETLNIIDESTIEGNDDAGNYLKYTKMITISGKSLLLKPGTGISNFLK